MVISVENRKIDNAHVRYLHQHLLVQSFCDNTCMTKLLFSDSLLLPLLDRSAN